MRLNAPLLALQAIFYLITGASSFVLPCGNAGHPSSCRMALHVGSGKCAPSFNFTLMTVYNTLWHLL